jgi:hypothetical protein
MQVLPFHPASESNQILTATANTVGYAEIPSTGKSIRILNTGSGVLHVRTYGNRNGASPDMPATTASYPIAAGQASVFSKGAIHNRLSFYSTAGTTFHVMLGEGY